MTRRPMGGKNPDYKPALVWFTDEKDPLHADNVVVNNTYIYYVKEESRGYIPWHRVEEVVRCD